MLIFIGAAADAPQFSFNVVCVLMFSAPNAESLDDKKIISRNRFPPPRVVVLKARQIKLVNSLLMLQLTAMKFRLTSAWVLKIHAAHRKRLDKHSSTTAPFRVDNIYSEHRKRLNCWTRGIPYPCSTICSVADTKRRDWRAETEGEKSSYECQMKNCIFLLTLIWWVKHETWRPGAKNECLTNEIWKFYWCSQHRSHIVSEKKDPTSFN